MNAGECYTRPGRGAGERSRTDASRSRVTVNASVKAQAPGQPGIRVRAFFSAQSLKTIEMFGARRRGWHRSKLTRAGGPPRPHPGATRSDDLPYGRDRMHRIRYMLSARQAERQQGRLHSFLHDVGRQVHSAPAPLTLGRNPTAQSRASWRARKISALSG